MNIVTEITPNPETLKFKVSKDLLKSNGIEFKRVQDAQENKFIEELFGIDGVKSIFVGSNFVSITIIDFPISIIQSGRPIFSNDGCVIVSGFNAKL